MNQPKNNVLRETLVKKASMKQLVYKNTLKQFEHLHKAIAEKVTKLKAEITNEDVRLSVLKAGEVEAQVAIGSDILVFHMHTNVFRFPDEDPIWKSSYLEKDATLGYCGIINIYNFLYDSFHYGRLNDSGYLIARILINKDNHFIVEGKGQLGFLFRDFINKQFDEKEIDKIVEQAFFHAVEFDLLTPPYNIVSEVTVNEMQNLISDLKLKTGKRMGFQFSAENDTIR